eukprot:TRINITY_DN14118_c0_g1_i1.p1 TRINITY_DN14118_c0_g1~~TRINITY_DN14118_c0_g1_i1.p1  ORF type:complete len:251 (-),score=34.74 TRINITY_DN14118_c0_g1_i1:27-713(-)
MPDSFGFAVVPAVSDANVVEQTAETPSISRRVKPSKECRHRSVNRGSSSSSSQIPTNMEVDESFDWDCFMPVYSHQDDDLIFSQEADDMFDWDSYVVSRRRESAGLQANVVEQTAETPSIYRRVEQDDASSKPVRIPSKFQYMSNDQEFSQGNPVEPSPDTISISRRVDSPKKSVRVRSNFRNAPVDEGFSQICFSRPTPPAAPRTSKAFRKGRYLVKTLVDKLVGKK